MADSHLGLSNEVIVKVENEKGNKPNEDQKHNDQDKPNEEVRCNFQDEQHKEEVIDKQTPAGKNKDEENKVNKDQVAKNNSKMVKIAKYGFITLGILIVVNAIILLPMSLLATAVTKSLDPKWDQTGRSSGMIIIAVAATISLVIAVYAIVVAVKEKRKHLHGVGLAFLIVGILAIVVAASTLNVSPDSEVEVTRSMVQSFKLANSHNPRSVRQWDYYQDRLNCCGIYGPDDYRHGLPPFLPADVPASCCPDYDVTASDADLEKMRNECKTLRKYHTSGCRTEVVDTLSDAAFLVQSISIVLIIFLFVEGPLGLVLAKLLKSWHKQERKLDVSSQQRKLDEENAKQKV